MDDKYDFNFSFTIRLLTNIITKKGASSKWLLKQVLSLYASILAWVTWTMDDLHKRSVYELIVVTHTDHVYFHIISSYSIHVGQIDQNEVKWQYNIKLIIFESWMNIGTSIS